MASTTSMRRRFASRTRVDAVAATCGDAGRATRRAMRRAASRTWVGTFGVGVRLRLARRRRRRGRRGRCENDAEAAARLGDDRGRGGPLVRLPVLVVVVVVLLLLLLLLLLVVLLL